MDRSGAADLRRKTMTITPSPLGHAKAIHVTHPRLENSPSRSCFLCDPVVSSHQFAMLENSPADADGGIQAMQHVDREHHWVDLQGGECLLCGHPHQPCQLTREQVVVKRSKSALSHTPLSPLPSNTDTHYDLCCTLWALGGVGRICYSHSPRQLFPTVMESTTTPRAHSQG